MRRRAKVGRAVRLGRRCRRRMIHDIFYHQMLPQADMEIVKLGSVVEDVLEPVNST